MTPTELKTLLFHAEPGVEWELRLSRPNSGPLPIVSFNDTLGYNCGVDVALSRIDPRSVTVRSRSGLPLSGTISVLYRAEMRAVLAREKSSPCEVREVRSA